MRRTGQGRNCVPVCAHLFVSPVCVKCDFLRVTGFPGQDAILTVSINFLDCAAGKRHSIPVCYRAMPGLEADDMISMVRNLFTELNVEASKIVCVSADGASVNGTRRIPTSTQGKNLCSALRRWTGNRILSIHCTCHRLQLATSESYRHPYLKDGAGKSVDGILSEITF